MGLKANLVSQPIGSVGQLQVDESAGVLTISIAASEQDGALSEKVELDVNMPALVTAWAAGTTNLAVKEALQILESLLAGLPK